MPLQAILERISSIGSDGMGQSGRPKGSKDTKERKKKKINTNIDEVSNAALISFVQEITPETRGSVKDVPELERRFERYLELCKKRNMKLSNMMAYTAMGIDFAFVSKIINSDRDDEISNFLRKVKNMCSSYREALMAEGLINNIVGIFWQKNYDGLKDSQEHVITPNNPLGNPASEKELAKRYIENSQISSISLDEPLAVIDTTINEKENIEL